MKVYYYFIIAIVAATFTWLLKNSFHSSDPLDTNANKTGITNVHNITDSLSSNNIKPSSPTVPDKIYIANESVTGKNLFSKIGFFDSSKYDNPSDNVFHIKIDQNFDINTVAYLEYELYGVGDFNSICKAINNNLSFGGVLVKISNSWSKQCEKIPASQLKKGDNTILFSASPDCNYGYLIKNVSIRFGESIGNERRLVVNQPSLHYYYKKYGYISGFVTGVGAENAKVYANGKLIRSNNSLFEGRIDKQGDTTQTLQAVITAVFDDGQSLSTTISFDKPGDLDYVSAYQPEIPYAESFVNENTEIYLAVKGFSLKGEIASVLKNTKLSVTALRAQDMSPVGPEIINVTAENSGYRCLPHGTIFNKPQKIHIKYDTLKIPKGYGPDDIQTFYFDESAKDWVMLPIDTIDKNNSEIVSLTDHFTDFISGILKTPEAPLTEAFTPTSMKDLKYADPLAGLNIMQPPSANNFGSANLSLPIIIPNGKQGMQPSLSVSYNSNGDNGFLGNGWSINLPAITVDTRWGVPHYFSDRESESYLLNGEELLPEVHRDNFKSRQSGDKVFTPKVEGAFDKIIRHGNNPKEYWWEVIDKQGIKYYYGKYSSDNSVNSNCILTDAAGNIAHWALAEVLDLNNYNITYWYKVITYDIGNSVLTKEIYISSINYTGYQNNPAKYTVDFIFSKDVRPDYTMSARYGFLQTCPYLLNEIQISYDSEFIRSYVFIYKDGDYYKQLLCLIADVTNELELDEIRELNCNSDLKKFVSKFHQFDYYSATNEGFSEEVLLPTEYDDGSLSLLEGALSNQLFPSLGKTKSTAWSVGGSLNVGIGGNVCSKINSIGAGINYSQTKSITNLMLMDINGDGLPDRVYKDGGVYKYRKLMLVNNALLYDDDEYTVTGLSSIGKMQSKAFSWGLEGQVLIATGSFSHTRSDNITKEYFADVNADGFIDFIKEDRVYYNNPNASGNPVFVPESNDSIQYIYGNPCNYIIRSGQVNDSVYTPFIEYDEKTGENLTKYYAYSRDAVRLWIAPYTGTVNLVNRIQLLEDTTYSRRQSHTVDGIKYSVQKNAQIFWGERITPSDYTIHSKDTSFNVSKGDRLYFRLQSISNRLYDNTSWNPVIKYSSINGNNNIDTNSVDGEGKKLAVFRPSDDLLINDRKKFSSPFDGTVNVKGAIQVNAVSDTVFFSVKYGATVWKQYTFPANTTSTYSINENLLMSKDTSLTFSVYTNTNVDLHKINTNFRLIYLSEGYTTLDTTKASQRIVVKPQMVYNIHQNTKQISTPVSLSNGYHYVSPNIVTSTLPPSLQNSTIVFAVKNGNNTIGKWNVPVIGINPPVFNVYFPSGNSYFEYYCKNDIADYILSATVVVDSSFFSPSPAGLHACVPDSLWKFGNLYRGWGQFSYYDAADTVATTFIPIKENLLHYSELVNDTTLITFDTTAIIGDGKIIPGKGNDQSHNPFNSMWADIDSMVFRDYAFQAYITPMKICNTVNSLITNDTIYDSPLIIGSGGNPNVKTIGKSSVDITNAYSVGLSMGVTFSYAHHKTKSKTVMDYLDMNGDRYPDLVGLNNVQFTTPQGGLFNNIVPLSINTTKNSESIGNGFATGVNLPKSGQPFFNFTGSIDKSTDSQYPSIGGSCGFNGYKVESVSDYQIFDVNGDGLPDKVEDKFVQLNLGYSFTPQILWNTKVDDLSNSLSVSTPGNIAVNYNQFSWSFGLGLGFSRSNTNHTNMDINGDGLLDYIYKSGNNLNIIINNGHAMGDDDTFSPKTDLHNSVAWNSNITTSASGGFTIFGAVKIVINVQASISASSNLEKVMLVDMNNDGYPDIVKADSVGSNISVRFNNLGKINFLKKVTTPTNTEYSLDYNITDCDQEMPQRHWVMASLKVYDGFSGDGVDTLYKKFEYAGGYYDRFERRFFGFDSVVTKQYYNFSIANSYRYTIEKYLNTDFLFKGLKKYEALISGSNIKAIETFYTYNKKEIATGRIIPEDSIHCFGKYYPAISIEDKYFFDTTGTMKVHTQTKYTHGKYGNIIKYENLGDVAIPGDDAIAYISYKSDTIKNILAMCDTLIVKNSQNSVLRKKTASYNTIGKITNLRNYLTTSTYAETEISYDTHGNISELLLPQNTNSQRMAYYYTYDSELQTYPVTISDALGFSVQKTWDYRLGLMTSITDITGNTTQYTYYADGKIKTIRGPNEIQSGAYFTVKYEYYSEYPPFETPGCTIANYAITVHHDPINTNNKMMTYTMSDGLGRVIQTKKKVTINGVDSLLVSGKTEFDAFGRPLKIYLPVTENVHQQSSCPSNTWDTTSYFYNYAQSHFSSTAYDILDRPLLQTAPDLTTIGSKYDFGSDAFSIQRFKTIITDQNNHSTISFTSPQGLQTSVTNSLNGITKFEYDPLGQMLSSVDPENNTTTYSYDLAGRLLQRVHPDAGTTSYTYDAAGNLLTTQTQVLSQLNKVINYNYNYNQLLTIIYPDNPENNVYYIYGTPSDGNKAGRIKRMQDASGIQSFNYGKMGEIVQNIHTFVVPNGISYTFEMNWQYDSWNRLKQITYPDAEVVVYNYNNAGQLKKVFGVKGNDSYAYIDSLTYNRYGSRSYIKYGNGSYATYSYSPLNFLLTNMKSYRTADSLMQNINYTYDNAKNITSIANTAGFVNLSLGGAYSYEYTYDNIYRLTASSGSFQSYANGNLTFSLGMTYSPSGNITNKTVNANTLINGGITPVVYNNNYTYSLRPHTVTTAGSNTYSWDLNGNMIQRSGQGSNRYMCWDEENRLMAVRDYSEDSPQRLTSYLYNASGDRTWKLTGEVEQMSLNGLTTVNMLTLNKTLYSSPYMVVNESQYTKHFYIEGERICSKIGGGFGTTIPQDPVDSAGGGGPVNIAAQLWTLVLRGLSCVGNTVNDVYISPDFASIDYNVNTTETLLYYYHPDHLGSSSFITNLAGNSTEHLQYLPYGENFVSQRFTRYSIPYKFSGKEKDDETQYSYFGARYYDSDLSIWLSVDPLAGKYPSLSPYNYCAGNPVKFIDPDGSRIFGTDHISRKYMRQYLKSEFGSNKLFRFNINGELVVRNRQFNKYINNSSISASQIDIANGMKEAINRPEIVNVTVQKSNTYFEFSDCVYDKSGNLARFGATAADAGFTINPKNTKSIKEFHIGIVDDMAQVETYKSNDIETKIGKDDIITQEGTTGKSASSVFIHEVLDEFLNYYTKHKTNNTSTPVQRTEFHSKSLNNKGLPSKITH